MKKDNIIEGLNKRIDNFANNKDENNNNFKIKEILISNPTKALNSLNDELILYKELYLKLTEQMAHIKKALTKSELLVNVSFKSQF